MLLTYAQRTHSRLLDINGYYVFLAIFLLTCVNIYLGNELLFTKKIYYQTFGEQVALERIDRYFEFRDQMGWLAYAFAPVILLIKVGYTAICIDIGMLFTKNESTIKFKKLFKIALLAELIFITAAYAKTAWLVYVADVNTLHDIQKFYPLSLINFVHGMPDWMSYPLLTVNFFELFYITALAAGVASMMNKGFKNAFVLTLFSYGTGLLLWTVFVVFLTINLT